jgi:hypothetical protein
MKKAITAIRGLDEEVLRRFKARAVEERLKMGEALTLATKKWMREKGGEKTDPKYLLKIKPFDWGKGTEKTSKEIDKILYGGKR